MRPHLQWHPLVRCVRRKLLPIPFTKFAGYVAVGSVAFGFRLALIVPMDTDVMISGKRAQLNTRTGQSCAPRLPGSVESVVDVCF